jgi:hypothetical protein
LPPGFRSREEEGLHEFSLSRTGIRSLDQSSPRLSSCPVRAVPAPTIPMSPARLAHTAQSRVKAVPSVDFGHDSTSSCYWREWPLLNRYHEHDTAELRHDRKTSDSDGLSTEAEVEENGTDETKEIAKRKGQRRRNGNMPAVLQNHNFQGRRDDVGGRWKDGPSKLGAGVRGRGGRMRRETRAFYGTKS